ncbi:replication protein A 70 kDa DNA-binding subunit A-like [Brassica napus]|uniref:replication protein A 70 kDa DNA-binding subunit A-like n=1 Tax=Brassica napus TaxID=3708 RepID=UPI00207AB5B9|nr:replication protein A 70 kDa DNA-binding subunit A-like [Brassica napus]
MAAITLVSDLKPFKTMWKIRVKIIRLWKQYSAAGGLTIEMVLIDYNGVKINASVKKDLVNQFDSFLSQGSSNILINFSLNPSCDVIGQIVELTPIEVASANGKETHKLTLELRNEKDERLPMVLWGNFATDVSDAIQGRGENAIICVLRFGKIKVWKDERSVLNAYNVSDVELNPLTPEVEAFASLLPKDELALAIVEAKPLALTTGVGDKNDFLVNTPRKTISVEQCIVMCTIAAIESDMGWYYLSCKVCSKKVLNVPNDNIDEQGDEDEMGFHYYCVKCKVKNSRLMPRYKLHLVVLDNTGNSKFLLFDAIAMQILNHLCNELTGSNFEEMQDPEDILLALKDLVGKNYLFKIGIERLGALTTLAIENSVISDAPEGSFMLNYQSSQECG